MTREARKQKNEIGVKKYSYNTFSHLQDETKCTFAINLGIKNLSAGEKCNQHLRMNTRQQHLRYGKRRPWNLKIVV